MTKISNNVEINDSCKDFDLSSYNLYQLEAELVPQPKFRDYLKENFIRKKDAKPFNYNIYHGIMVEKEWLTRANIGLDRVCVDSFETASASIAACDRALEKVSSARSNMGAYMNRMEYAVAVDDNTSENVQSSESRLRDTDMADEMVQYSRSNILAQAGQSMLAQANQSTQGILSLLQ